MRCYNCGNRQNKILSVMRFGFFPKENLIIGCKNCGCEMLDVEKIHFFGFSVALVFSLSFLIIYFSPFGVLLDLLLIFIIFIFTFIIFVPIKKA